MSYDNEFETVTLVRNSTAETRGVDSFSLALIKAERQIRKLVTHLVYQNTCFTVDDVPVLRETLAKNRKVYFEGFIRGFDAINQNSVEVLVGTKYQELLDHIKVAIKHRNKIFHGQLTNSNLSRNDLLEYVDSIQEWCQLLGKGAENEIGYNGFARNSFQKSTNSEIQNSFKVLLKSVQEYEAFIQNNMQRP